MDYFSDLHTDLYDDEDWEIEPWDDKSWRRIPVILLIGILLYIYGHIKERSSLRLLRDGRASYLVL